MFVCAYPDLKIRLRCDPNALANKGEEEMKKASDHLVFDQMKWYDHIRFTSISEDACIRIPIHTTHTKTTLVQINQYYYIENGIASDEKEYYICVSMNQLSSARAHSRFTFTFYILRGVAELFYGW